MRKFELIKLYLIVGNHYKKFQLKMGLLTLTQIPCHHVSANEIALNLKYRIGLKHFFNINLGICIIKKTTFFVCIFDISPRVFAQISIGRAHWMRNLILHPEISLNQNLSKNTGRYVENTNKKSSFFYDTYPQIYIKKLFKRCSLIEF